MEKLAFTELPISVNILNAVQEMGFEEASPIQSRTIPLMMEGKDVIGQAQTGTGKTAAFAIPVIEKLDPKIKKIQALVLCPTRELVIQVTEEFRKLMKFTGSVSDSSVVAVYGGQEIDRQFRALKKNPFVIVGTPGRVMDHMRRGTLKFDAVSSVVLDEADEMLDMGFHEDIEYIFSTTAEDRQTVMFSATMSKPILALTEKFQKDPIHVDVTGQKKAAPDIEQYYYEIPQSAKPEAIARLLDFYNTKLALVFCNTKSKVDELVEILKTRGYFADALHGDMSQRQREKVMTGFRSGSVEVLVATDVAGRGIDVKNIDAVFNYDLPRDDEDYIHRIGRTGRAGQSGKSFTFVTGREVYHLRRIEKTNNINIKRGKIPSIDDLDSSIVKGYGEKIKKTLEEGSFSRYVHLVEGVMADEYTALDIAAALLKLATDNKSGGYDENLNFEVKHYDGDRDRGGDRGRSRSGGGGDRYRSGGGDRYRSGGGGDRDRSRSSGGDNPRVKEEKPEGTWWTSVYGAEKKAERSSFRSSSSHSSSPRSSSGTGRFSDGDKVKKRISKKK